MVTGILRKLIGEDPILNFGRLVITGKETILTDGQQLKKQKPKKKRKKIKYFKLIGKALDIKHILMHITRS